MKKLLIICIFFSGIAAHAQTPEDALRTAWFTQNGTARNMAVGGTMGSLGGDITANHVNPAGLGFYKTNELVLSPGFLFNNNKFNFRGTDSTGKKSAFGYGTSGIILAGNKRRKSTWISSAFAISVNQLANYNNRVQYTGFNNYSSFTEKYLEELTRDRADTNAALSNYIFGSSLAFRTFLVDTISGPGGTVAGYQSLVPISQGVKQLYDAQSSGGYNEIAIGTAGNIGDQLYLGISFTIPIIKYTRNLFYSEKDPTADGTNSFSFFEYRETYSSSGAGIGAKLGMIYKPQESLRLGFAFHTPQLIGFTDNIRSSMVANTETYAGLRSESSDALNNGRAGVAKYNMTTPWRMIGSVSYVLREVNDVRMQKGFISADIEYVHYKGARFNATSGDAGDIGLSNYYSMLNETIKDTYRGNVNIRLGGELKFNTIMVRLGTAYYGSPYKDQVLKASRFIGSGGLGYRNKGMFIDLTYSHILNKDVQFPYLLNDKANTFAVQKGSRGSLMLTLGFKI
ncbi:MAG: outer membrane protein transport protein [Sphingobacteriia bacterium]|nr:outer membrane protein transport protein [Sphingobacteriia bacterium]